MAEFNPTNDNNKPIRVADSKSHKQLKDILDAISKSNAEAQDSINNTIRETSNNNTAASRATEQAISSLAAESKARESREKVASLAAERRNRAVDAALQLDNQKRNKSLNLLKDTLTDGIKELGNILKSSFASSLKSIDDLTRSLREERLASDEIAKYSLQVNKVQKLLSADKSFGNVSNNQIAKTAKELASAGRHDILNNETALRNVTLAMQSGITDIQEAIQYADADDKTMRGMVDSNYSNIKYIMSDIRKSLSPEALAKIGDLSQQEKGIQDAATAAFTKISASALSPQKQAELVAAIMNQQAGIFNEKDGNLLLKYFGTTAVTLDNMDKLLVSNLEKNKDPDKLQLVLNTMDESDRAEYLRMANAYKPGKSIGQELESEETLNQRKADYTESGKFQQLADRFVAGIDVGTGGFLSNISAVMNEYLGVNGSLEGVVMNTLPFIAKLLAAIAGVVAAKKGADFAKNIGSGIAGKLGFGDKSGGATPGGASKLGKFGKGALIGGAVLGGLALVGAASGNNEQKTAEAVSSLNKTNKDLNDNLKNTEKDLKSAAQSMQDSVKAEEENTNLLNDIASGISSVADTTKNIVTQSPEAVASIAGGVVAMKVADKAIEKAIPIATKAAMKVAVKAGATFATANAIGSAIPGIGNAIATGVSAVITAVDIGGALVDIGKSIQDNKLITDLTAKYGEELAEPLSNISDQLISEGSSFEKYMSVYSDKGLSEAELVKVAAEATSKQDLQNKALNALGEKTFYKNVQNIRDAVLDIAGIESYKDSNSANIDINTNLWEDIKAGFTTAKTIATDILWPAIRSVLSKALDGVKSISGKVVEGVKQLPSLLGQFLKKLPQMLVDALLFLPGLLFKGIEFAVNKLPGLVTDFVNKLPEYFSSFMDFLGEMCDKVFEGFVSAGKAILGFITDIPGYVVDFISSLPNFFGNAFNAVVDVIKSPINSIISGVNEAFTIELPGWIPKIGGKTWSLDLPMFANGGVVNNATPAVVGEDGKEAILPLTKPEQLAEVLNLLSPDEKSRILRGMFGKDVTTESLTKEIETLFPSSVLKSLSVTVGAFFNKVRNYFTDASTLQPLQAQNGLSTSTVLDDLPKSEVPGDDPSTIQKILDYAGSYRQQVWELIDKGRTNKPGYGFKKRKEWYQEALSNAANQEGRDLIKGTYAEKALEFGVSQLGKPYILNSLGKIGYVCNELVNACLKASGFDTGKFRINGVKATFANIQKGKYSGDDYPNFRLRPDLTPETALPGMVFFQDSRKNKEGGFQPGHIGFVYYGHQKLHSSGGSAKYEKDTFLPNWQTPCRGVTVTPFDSNSYMIGEFPGLFEKINSGDEFVNNSEIPFGPTELSDPSAISNNTSFAEQKRLAKEAIDALLANAGADVKQTAAQYAQQAYSLLNGSNSKEVLNSLSAIIKYLRDIANSPSNKKQIPAVNKPVSLPY